MCLIVQTVPVHFVTQIDPYPMSLSYGQDQLWVGDKAGNVHLLDATDGDFNIVKV